MIKFIEFVKRYAHFFIFGIYFILSLNLIVNNNFYQKHSWLNSSNSIVGQIYSVQNSFSKYMGLQDRNRLLQNENSLLREQLHSRPVQKTMEPEVFSDTFLSLEYSIIPALIVKNSFNKKANYLTINIGSNSGIKKGMGVLSASGVLGIVKATSANYSLVISCLNTEEFGISSSLVPLELNDGILIWEGKSPYNMKLDGISKFEKVKRGMLLVTGPYNRRFPPGTNIGKVKRVETPTNGSFFDIDIELSTNFTKVKEVYVVKDLKDTEISKLESLQIDK